MCSCDDTDGLGIEYVEVHEKSCCYPVCCLEGQLEEKEGDGNSGVQEGKGHEMV